MATLSQLFRNTSASLTNIKEGIGIRVLQNKPLPNQVEISLNTDTVNSMIAVKLSNLETENANNLILRLNDATGSLNANRLDGEHKDYYLDWDNFNLNTRPSSLAAYGIISNPGLVLESVTPTIATHAASKGYVDTAVGGLRDSIGTLTANTAFTDLQLLVATKAPWHNPTFTGSVDFTDAAVGGIDSHTVGLGNIPNDLPDAWPISADVRDALLTKAPHTNPILSGTIRFASGCSVSGFTPTNAGLPLIPNLAPADWIISDNVQDALDALDAKKLNVNTKDQINGYVSLGSNGLINPNLYVVAATGLSYLGNWSGNTGLLVPEGTALPVANSGNKGSYYIVTVQGTYNVNGMATWSVGDHIQSNGISWVKTVDVSTSGVRSINDMSGVVTITKSTVGLSLIPETNPNTWEPSTPTVTILNSKADKASPTIASPTFTGTSTFSGIVNFSDPGCDVNGLHNTDVGLGNIPNTAPAGWIVSDLTWVELNKKATIMSPAFTGSPNFFGCATVANFQPSWIGLGNVQNTADKDKGISDSVELYYATKANPTFTGMTIRFGPATAPNTPGTHYNVLGLTKTMVGLGDIPSTDPISWTINTATDNELKLKALKTNTVLLGNATFANVIAANFTAPGSVISWPTFNQPTDKNAATSSYAISLYADKDKGLYQVYSLGVGGAAPTAIGEIAARGNITAYYSDERLKTIISPIQNALDKVLSLDGVIYKSNDLAATFGYTDTREQIGILAQQVEKVLPQIVVPAPFDSGENNTSLSGENYKTVHYDKLIPLLIEAIKELNAKIESKVKK